MKNGKIATVQTILQLSRPRFWPYLAGPYLIGYAAVAPNISSFTTAAFWIVFLYFLVPANILIYGINDYFDRETDALNTKKTRQETRITGENEALYRSAILFALISTIPLFFFLPWQGSMTLLLFLFLGIGYSMPPFRLKARPVLDSASNFLYAVPGLIGVFQLSESGPSLPVLLAAICWTAAMHLFSAIPDIEADTKAGVRTSAVVLGKRASLGVCTVLWIVAGGTATLINPVLSFTLLYPLIPLWLLVHPITDITRVYWIFPYLNLGAGFVLFWSVVLT
ncbi:MAG: prenyltransferase [Patescibacteria group bacterium]|nr:prenyltransferase [Patescibacteria group bacterium]